MAMPRPSGKAQRLAEQVIPGLQRETKKSRGGAVDEEFMSKVEIIETDQIDNKKGIKMKRQSQGYNDRMDESLGMRRGPERKFKQSMKDRRDEAKGMNKKSSGRAYKSVRSMDKK